MKQIHYLAAIALGALIVSSCSSDEVVSSVEEPNVISFKAMANKSSRSGDVATQNISRFRVFGCATDNGSIANAITVFNNTIVTRTEDTNNWSYNGIQYWAPNKDYYFVAISTNNPTPAWEYSGLGTIPAGTTVDNFKGCGTVTMDISGVNADRDLVYSYATRQTDATISNSTDVPFTFHHMLSRVKVKFVNQIANNAYTLNIADVKIGGLSAKASVDFGVEPKDLAWTVADGVTATVTAVTPSDNIATNETNGHVESDNKFIIPSQQALTIEFTVNVKLNGNQYSSRTMKGTIANMTFVPGTSYLFTANISADNIADGGAKPIVFTVTSVDGWGDDTAGEIEFPQPENPGN